MCHDVSAVSYTHLDVYKRQSLSFLSTGQPTYWPSDSIKIPDLIDFFRIRGLPHKHKVDSYLHFFCDHAPVIAIISNTIIYSESVPTLLNLNAEHLVLFQPEVRKNVSFIEEVRRYLHSPCQLALPIRPFKVNEVKEIIQYHLECKKAPRIYLLSGIIVKELPHKGFLLITYTFNAILRL